MEGNGSEIANGWWEIRMWGGGGGRWVNVWKCKVSCNYSPTRLVSSWFWHSSAMILAALWSSVQRPSPICKASLVEFVTTCCLAVVATVSQTSAVLSNCSTVVLVDDCGNAVTDSVSLLLLLGCCLVKSSWQPACSLHLSWQQLHSKVSDLALSITVLLIISEHIDGSFASSTGGVVAMGSPGHLGTTTGTGRTHVQVSMMISAEPAWEQTLARWQLEQFPVSLAFSGNSSESSAFIKVFWPS